MSTIDLLKEQTTPPTPLFLFDCVLPSGAVEHWSTHAVNVNGNAYLARLLQHNLFTLQVSAEDGLDSAQKISVTLANADSHYSQLEREVGFKGSQVTIQVLFYDLTGGAAASESRVIFQGMANPPDEITQATFRMTIGTRLNLQRVVLPDISSGTAVPLDVPRELRAAFGGHYGRRAREIFALVQMRILGGPNGRRRESKWRCGVCELRLHPDLVRGSRHVFER